MMRVVEGRGLERPLRRITEIHQVNTMKKRRRNQDRVDFYLEESVEIVY
jgi:hypothetical protein